MLRTLSCAVAILLCSLNALGDSKEVPIASLNLLTIPAGASLSHANIDLDNQDSSQRAFTKFLQDVAISETPDYWIVNVVQWDKAKVKSSDWIVYNKELPSKNPWRSHKALLSQSGRIFGSNSIGILVVSNGVQDKAGCQAFTYSVTAKHITPKNVENLRSLVSAVLSGGIGKLEEAVSCYGWVVLKKGFPALPLDITVAAQGDDSVSSLTSTIHDEGYYWWDVSVGMPLATYKNLNFNSENNIVVPKSTDKINPYAFGDIYPFGADLNAQGFTLQPKLSIGLPIGSRPLNYPFFGAGLNLAIHKFRFSPFAGILYQKVDRTRTLGPGSPADQASLDRDRYTKRVAKLMYGLSFSVSDALKLFKK